MLKINNASPAWRTTDQAQNVPKSPNNFNKIKAFSFSVRHAILLFLGLTPATRIGGFKAFVSLSFSLQKPLGLNENERHCEGYYDTDAHPNEKSGKV